MKKILSVASIAALALVTVACTDRDATSNSTISNDTVILDNGSVATTVTNTTTTTKH